VDDERICDLVKDHFPLTPGGIIKYLDLRRPIYRKTAAGGHFGRQDADFSWEKTDSAAKLAEAAGIEATAR
jgi:S-adenosylmethionine synthetase